jgi:hypothetical protein
MTIRRLATSMVLLAAAAALSAQGREPLGPSARVRPFITDDARTVGDGLGQFETWYRGDVESHQQWLLAAYGPTDRLELTIGGVAGVDRRPRAERAGEPRATYALPLLQAKYLVRPYTERDGLGLAGVVGTFLPGGQGLLQPPGYGTFGFVIGTWRVTRSEDVLVHANVGMNRLWIDAGPDETVGTWGVGTQVRTVGGLHVVAELFSGDPYVPGSGLSWQAGARHFVSDRLQLDATIGRGIAGATRLPTWTSVGLRWVFGPTR